MPFFPQRDFLENQFQSLADDLRSNDFSKLEEKMATMVGDPLLHFLPIRKNQINSFKNSGFTLGVKVYARLEPSGAKSPRRRESNAFSGYTTGPSS